MSTALITSILGARDIPRALPLGVEVDTFLVTDQREAVAGWDTIIEQSPSNNPRLAARAVKTQPWKFVPGYEYYVWIDGSVELLDPEYPLWATERNIETIAAPAHPDRDCLFDEARAAETWPKYAGAEAYAESLRGSHPEHWGLWATTSIVWRNAPLAHTVAKSWWSACNIVVADQVSLPRVAKIHYTRPTTLPINLYENRWFKWHPHDS